MKRGVTISRGIALAVMLLAVPDAAPAQSGRGVEAAPGVKGIGLNAVQRKFIYENTAGEQPQVPRNRAALGAEVPDSLILNEMPIRVKDEVGLLRDFKFAVVEGAQAVLIVDPTNRRIVDIVSKDDASK